MAAMVSSHVRGLSEQDLAWESMCKQTLNGGPLRSRDETAALISAAVFFSPAPLLHIQRPLPSTRGGCGPAQDSLAAGLPDKIANYAGGSHSSWGCCPG